MPNESVGKVLLTSENNIFGGHLTLPNHKIVDCGALYEVIFFYISPKNLLGAFFYRLNAKAHREPGLSAIRWSRLLCSIFLYLRSISRSLKGTHSLSRTSVSNESLT